MNTSGQRDANEAIIKYENSRGFDFNKSNKIINVDLNMHIERLLKNNFI